MDDTKVGGVTTSSDPVISVLQVLGQQFQRLGVVAREVGRALDKQDQSRLEELYCLVNHTGIHTPSLHEMAELFMVK